MFYGEYEHAIDEKNRLTLPARFRNAFAARCGAGAMAGPGVHAEVISLP
jgi:DNA-binding transcriptional regulator/RsmH inhibitor MraZ